MHLVDYPDEHPPDSKISEVVEERFREHYLRPLGNEVRFVRLESRFGVKCQGYKLTQQCCSTEMHRQNGCCADLSCGHLIEKTAAALNDDVINLMLWAVQRGNLELSVKLALNK